MNINSLSINGGSFPKLLKEIGAAPKVIYYSGNIELADSFCLAIVGTRRASSYGKEIAAKLSRELSSQGIIIVSGLAHGIDEVAHKSALEASGKTIAVIGTGLDEKNIYPQANLGLANEIVEKNGLLISEYEEGVPALPHHFPQRNRIVSGLSHGVIVVEAPEKSGALITAQFALDQGREVFVVPGPINYLSFKGSNRLLQEGAKLVMETNDILNEFEELKNLSTEEKEKLLDLNKEERLIFETIKAKPQTLEELRVLTQWPVQKITVQISRLELKGVIKNIGGQYTIN